MPASGIKVYDLSRYANVLDRVEHALDMYGGWLHSYRHGRLRETTMSIDMVETGIYTVQIFSLY